jgi:hypothetical protein
MIAAIFGPNATIFAPLMMVLWVAPILANVNASKKTGVAFYQAKSSKTAWIVVLAVSNLTPFGWILATIYFASVRPKVNRFMGSKEF